MKCPRRACPVVAASFALTLVSGCQRDDSPPPPPAFRAQQNVQRPDGQLPFLPGQQAGQAFDLIPLIDPARDAVHGRWAVANGVLRCDDQHMVPRIQVPYRPPQEYDFTVTFEQPALRNGISLIMPNPNGGTFFWYVGRQGGEYGFSSERRNAEGRGAPVQTNVPHTTVVQVRRDGVRAYLNGPVAVEHRTDFRDLKSDRWRQVKDETVLAVACDDPTVFHAVRIAEITGQGQRTR
jgi:hypothetical protein